MKAKDAMTSPVVSVLPDTSLAEVAQLMLGKGIGSVLVVDKEGRLVGIVTESDFLKERGVPFSTFRAPMLLGRFLGSDGLEAVLAEAKSTRIEEIMSSPVHAVGPEEPLSRVLELMLAYDINHVPVVDGEGKPLGIITRFDLLRLLQSQL
ncbi:CBS domain-containing protein [Thermus scotoductus]|uniref:CBS domain-containing protein n=2 Tax=Thermus TaxID=270 RepID=A0A430S874_THESC|nr:MULTISPECIES: CBS domain-containing protein [Thermus]APD08431.1 acetoin dehydrogenase AcuB [Thermus brockianus]ETN88701.1 signal transduction protein [Thermus sp. NMX2.A1]RTG96154.1 CBS domain-containing protein [Thermus scotoductus]RTH06974.1 CBS domain-containing protein [Thermus scotoductus]RTH09425.1 CBS domain-containing protein [Thermus scotoductus]